MLSARFDWKEGVHHHHRNAKKNFLFYEIHWINNYVKRWREHMEKMHLSALNKKEFTNTCAKEEEEEKRRRRWIMKIKYIFFYNINFENGKPIPSLTISIPYTNSSNKRMKNDVNHMEFSAFKADFPPDLRTKTMKNHTIVWISLNDKHSMLILNLCSSTITFTYIRSNTLCI